MTIYSFISAFAAGFAVATLYYLGIATPYNKDENNKDEK